MPAAAILFTDIAGFSRLTTAEQLRLSKSLRDATRAALAPNRADVAEPAVIALPTGDGMALVFLDDVPDAWLSDSERYDDVIRQAIHLTSWADREDVGLYVGIHIGEISRVIDVNDNANVCGDAINLAQRVMSAADCGQTLLSEAAVPHFLGEVGKSRTVDVDGVAYTVHATSSVIDVYAKHDRRVAIVPLSLTSDSQSVQAPTGWKAHTPSDASILPVTLTPEGTPVENDFAARLAAAREIALIQLTGSRLAAALDSGAIRLGDQLERLWVFLPSAESAPRLGALPPMDQLAGLAGAWDDWRRLKAKLRTDHPDAEIELYRYDSPPYLGASFLDWNEQGGRIHVSPYVWGLDSPRCPGFDLHWRVKQRHRVYAAYVRGLTNLEKSSHRD